MKKFIWLLMFAAFTAQAETVQWAKGFTAGCDNPTTRTDGTELLPEEIALVRYYVDPSDGNIVTPTYMVIMNGGCVDTFIDTKRFLPVGDYFRYGVTVDTDGLESVASDGVGITIRKANPNAPGGIR